MGENSGIEWTDDTLNPIRYRPEGRTKSAHICLKLSPGCDHCYASRLQGYLNGGSAFAPESTAKQAFLQSEIAAGRLYLDRAVLAKPVRQQRPRRIFVGSMTDVFGSWVPRAWQVAIWGMMACAPQHTFQVLTKRAHELRDFLREDVTACDVYGAQYGFRPANAPSPPAMDWPLRNVWVGVSVESDAYAWRARVLADTPAAVRWVSAEPLLGPLPRLELVCQECLGNGSCDYGDGAAYVPGGCRSCQGAGRALDWLVVGGESGGPPDRALVMPCPRHRTVTEQRENSNCPCGYDTTGQRGYVPKPEGLAWVEALRARAAAAGTAFHFKQWGGPRPHSGGRLLAGQTYDAYPEVPYVALSRVGGDVVLSGA